MSALIRSVMVAVLLIGTVSVVSAAPRRGEDAYSKRGEYQPGVMDKFNAIARRAT